MGFRPGWSGGKNSQNRLAVVQVTAFVDLTPRNRGAAELQIALAGSRVRQSIVSCCPAGCSSSADFSPSIALKILVQFRFSPLISRGPLICPALVELEKHA